MTVRRRLDGSQRRARPFHRLPLPAPGPPLCARACPELRTLHLQGALRPSLQSFVRRALCSRGWRCEAEYERSTAQLVPSARTLLTRPRHRSKSSSPACDSSALPLAHTTPSWCAPDPGHTRTTALVDVDPAAFQYNGSRTARWLGRAALSHKGCYQSACASCGAGCGTSLRRSFLAWALLLLWHPCWWVPAVP